MTLHLASLFTLVSIQFFGFVTKGIINAKPSHHICDEREKNCYEKEKLSPLLSSDIQI